MQKISNYLIIKYHGRRLGVFPSKRKRKRKYRRKRKRNNRSERTKQRLKQDRVAVNEVIRTYFEWYEACMPLFVCLRFGEISHASITYHEPSKMSGLYKFEGSSALLSYDRRGCIL